MTAKEIANRLNLPLTTINWRIHKLGIRSPYKEEDLESIVNFSIIERGSLSRDKITKRSIAQEKADRLGLPFKRVYYYYLLDNDISDAELFNKCNKLEELKEKRERKLKLELEKSSNHLIYPNYIYQKDILPLSEALKRGIYKNGMLNVFRDPNFKVRYVTKRAFELMILNEYGELY